MKICFKNNYSCNTIWSNKSYQSISKPLENKSLKNKKNTRLGTKEWQSHTSSFQFSRNQTPFPRSLCYLYTALYTVLLLLIPRISSSQFLTLQQNWISLSKLTFFFSLETTKESVARAFATTQFNDKADCSLPLLSESRQCQQMVESELRFVTSMLSPHLFCF